MAVFICYRRDDAEGEARALHSRLLEETPAREVFLDHDVIQPGQSWQDRIDEALAGVQAALIVVGPNWSRVVQERAARGETDIVRSEVASCLARPGLLVVPVLVKGATMPSSDALPEDIRSLTRRNALEVRGGAWRDDTARLVKLLRKAGALPVKRSTWAWRIAALAALPALAIVYAWARVEVPAVPLSMTQRYAQSLVEQAGLRFEATSVQQATFQGNVVRSADRGMLVAAGQRPAPGAAVFRGRTVQVDFIRREPYRLVCKGGGLMSAASSTGDMRFESHPGAGAADMKPGSCAWVTGPLHPNQDPVLRPLGFGPQLGGAFERAPGHVLTFCAYSEYDRANAQRSERLVALDYKQYLMADDNGRLRPVTAGHVCDDKL